MTFKGINLRSSAVHPSATDSADDTYWHRSGAEIYPAATRAPFTGGFGQASANAFLSGADRSGVGIDARLAGLCEALGTLLFKVTLPNGPGQYRVRIAIGDRLAARSVQSVSIVDSDGTTVLHSRTGISTPVDNFSDANGTVHTAANWPANNTTATVTFTGSVANIQFGAQTFANHIAFEPVATPGPTISVHPANQTVSTPTTATFAVTAAASGGGTLSYQWQRNPGGNTSFANVSTGTGGTTSSYITAATTVSSGNANNNDTWRCVVTETGGTNAGATNSTAATLTVNAGPTGPTINTQPSAQTVVAPATATFNVAATTSGGALSYQWQRNTVNIGGATSASYTTPATTVTGGVANNGDAYRCNVTDTNGTTTSSAGTLTVNAALAGLTSSALKNNAGTTHLSAPFEAFVLSATSGALVLRKTGLTSHASTGVVTFTDATLVAATQYRVVWRRTDTGAQGVELLTAA